MSLFVHGMGHFNPENEITNAFLESLDIGTTEQWILDRVGIHSRRTVLPLDYIRDTRNQDLRAGMEASVYTNAQMGEVAARMALTRAGLTPADIGMVIGGSSGPELLSPADGCNVAQRLGIEAPSFDMNSACTSYFIPIHMLNMLRPELAPRFILIVATESLTRTVNYNDRSTSVLWGDGAGAAVVSLTEPGRAEIVGTILESNPGSNDKVLIPRHTFFHQDGPAVQKFAVKRSVETVRRLRAAYTDPSRNFGFVGHQANYRMLESVCKLCSIPPDRHFRNVERFGNTGAAGSPTVLSRHWEEWAADDELAVVGVGAGLTWAGYMLRMLR